MKLLLLAPFLILVIPSTSIASNRNLNLYIDSFKPVSKEIDRSIKRANKAKRENNIQLLCEEITKNLTRIDANRSGLERLEPDRDWTEFKNVLTQKYSEYDCRTVNSTPDEIYFSSAKKKYKDKDYEGVIKDLTEAIKINSSVSNYFNLRGISKYELKDYQGAIDDYIKAIELDPKDAVLYSNRGNALRTVGDYEGSISDFSKAIELKPESADYYNARGFSKSRAGDYRGAISDYKKATELDPDEEVYSENLASAEEKLKYTENSKSEQKVSIKKNNGIREWTRDNGEVVVFDEYYLATTFGNVGWGNNEIKYYYWLKDNPSRKYAAWVRCSGLKGSFEEDGVKRYYEDSSYGWVRLKKQKTYAQKEGLTITKVYCPVWNKISKRVFPDQGIESFESWRKRGDYYSRALYKERRDGVSNSSTYSTSNENKKSIKTRKVVTADQKATCQKAKDYKGCMDYYSQNTKRKGSGFLGKLIRGLAGAGGNQQYYPGPAQNQHNQFTQNSLNNQYQYNQRQNQQFNQRYQPGYKAPIQQPTRIYNTPGTYSYP